MKLDHDCVRDLLLALEKHSTLDGMPFESLITLTELKKYTPETVVYVGSKLIEAGYLKGKYFSDYKSNHNLAIKSITYEGHVFLDTIRDNKIWSQIKQSASKVSGMTLPTILELGTAIVKKEYGL